MESRKPDFTSSTNSSVGTFFKWLIADAKRVILSSISIAFVMALFSFCLSRAEQSYAFISCAILWGAGLIALAICDKKQGPAELSVSNSEENAEKDPNPGSE